MRASTWAKWMRWLHIYSAMLVLVLLLFFAVTGITLNHPNWTLASGKESASLQIDLPVDLPNLLTLEESGHAVAIAAYVDWLREAYELKGSYSVNLMTDDALLEVDFKRPAGYASVVIDLENRAAEVQSEFGGYLALANDLHKGRYAGQSWRWLIDFTAVSCILFALSGFYLLWRQPSRRDFGNATAVAGVVLALLAYMASVH